MVRGQGKGPEDGEGPGLRAGKRARRRGCREKSLVGRSGDGKWGGNAQAHHSEAEPTQPQGRLGLPRPHSPL